MTNIINNIINKIEDLFDSDNFFVAFGTFLVFGFILAGILIGVISLFVYPFEVLSCKSKYADYKPSYGFFSECRIIYEGKLTPVNMIKNININK